VTLTEKITWESVVSTIEPQINAEGIHNWPFDPSFPIDVRFMFHDRPRDVRMNRHDYFELLFLCSGEAVLQIQERYFTLREGDLVVIGSTLFHRMIEFRRTVVRIAVLYFLPDLIRANDVSGENMEYLMPFMIQDSTFPHLVAADESISAEIFDLMRRSYAELRDDSKFSRLCVKAYLKMILALLVKHYADYSAIADSFNRRHRDITRLEPLFEYIDHHYTEPITVKNGASVACLSEPHFMRFFKQVTGQTFLEYLTHYRIAKAQVLLASTDKTIAEISQEVGFCDQSHFGLVFRRLLHVTPREYKHLHNCPPESALPRRTLKAV
jgi:AraC-like DNA-binding protein/mannose-6-phosphate isomerase-like protein (cupin superfamily)